MGVQLDAHLPRPVDPIASVMEALPKILRLWLRPLDNAGLFDAQPFDVAPCKKEQEKMNVVQQAWYRWIKPNVRGVMCNMPFLEPTLCHPNERNDAVERTCQINYDVGYSLEYQEGKEGEKKETMSGLNVEVAGFLKMRGSKQGDMKFWRHPGPGKEFIPDHQLIETDDHLEIRFDVPGYPLSELGIDHRCKDQVTGDLVTEDSVPSAQDAVFTLDGQAPWAGSLLCWDSSSKQNIKLGRTKIRHLRVWGRRSLPRPTPKLSENVKVQTVPSSRAVTEPWEVLIPLDAVNYQPENTSYERGVLSFKFVKDSD